MSDIFTCDLCCEKFNEGERKPLNLPCGHATCRQCLKKHQEMNNKTCPDCRADWSSAPLDSLSVSWRLIPAGPAGSSAAVVGGAGAGGGAPAAPPAQEDMCSAHDIRIDAHCLTCDVDMCNICAIQRHKTCSVLSRKEKLEAELEATVNEAQTNLRASEQLERKIDDTISILTEIEVAAREAAEHCTRLKRENAESLRQQRAVLNQVEEIATTDTKSVQTKLNLMKTFPNQEEEGATAACKRVVSISERLQQQIGKLETIISFGKI